MGNVQVGSTFKTGNSTVAQLPAGTVLTVVGQGLVKVGGAFTEEFSEPEAESIQQGDLVIDINKGNREGVVARTGVSLEGAVPSGFVLVINDETDGPVIRLAPLSSLQLA